MKLCFQSLVNVGITLLYLYYYLYVIFVYMEKYVSELVVIMQFRMSGNHKMDSTEAIIIYFG